MSKPISPLTPLRCYTQPQAHLQGSLAKHNLPHTVHIEPFFSNPADAPRRPTRSAGLDFRIPTSAVSELPPFGDRLGQSWQQRVDSAGLGEGGGGERGGGMADGGEYVGAGRVRNGRPLFCFTPSRRCTKHTSKPCY